jgi:hypothetical protein
MNEKQWAEMEAEMINSVDAYFAARPSKDSGAANTAFLAGFERGYRANLKPEKPMQPQLTREQVNAINMITPIG